VKFEIEGLDAIDDEFDGGGGGVSGGGSGGAVGGGGGYLVNVYLPQLFRFHEAAAAKAIRDAATKKTSKRERRRAKKERTSMNEVEGENKA
jgi:hypothetical protein